VVKRICRDSQKIVNNTDFKLLNICNCIRHLIESDQREHDFVVTFKTRLVQDCIFSTCQPIFKKVGEVEKVVQEDECDELLSVVANL